MTFNSFADLEHCITSQGFHWFKSGLSYDKSCDFWRRIDSDGAWVLVTSYGNVTDGYTAIFH